MKQKRKIEEIPDCYHQSMGWGNLHYPLVENIAERADILSTGRLARGMIGMRHAIRGAHKVPFGLPSLLHCDPETWPDDRDNTGIHALLMPLDKPTVPAFIHTKEELDGHGPMHWVGCNGDWVAFVQQDGHLTIRNIYISDTIIPLPSLQDAGISLGPTSEWWHGSPPFLFKYKIDKSLELLKVRIVKRPYKDDLAGPWHYEVIVVFDELIAILQAPLEKEWNILRNPEFFDRNSYVDAMGIPGYGTHAAPRLIDAPVIEDEEAEVAAIFAQIEGDAVMEDDEANVAQGDGGADEDNDADEEELEEDEFDDEELDDDGDNHNYEDEDVFLGFSDQRTWFLAPMRAESITGESDLAWIQVKGYRPILGPPILHMGNKLRSYPLSSPELLESRARVRRSPRKLCVDWSLPERRHFTRLFLVDHHFPEHLARDLQRPGKLSDPLLALWVRRSLAGDDDTRQPLICVLIQRPLSLVPLRRVMRRRQVDPTLSAQPAAPVACWAMDPIIPTEPFLQTQVYDLANGGDLIFERDLFALTDFLGRTPPVFYGGQISDNGQLQWLIMANLPGKPESPMFRQIQFSLRENTWVDGLAHALQESLARLCGQNSLAIEGERFAHFARHSSVGLPLSLPYHPVLRHHVDHLDYMLYETRSALSDSRSAANHTQQQLNQYAETIKVIAKERRTLRQLVAKRDATIHRLKTKIAVLKETISTQVEQLQILEGEGEGEDIQGDGYSYVSNDNDYEPEEEGDDDFHQTLPAGMDTTFPLRIDG
ncbi:hypothetical protein QYE76_008035 [Lolium multiflorum]|uniref:Uncharacterized protein n=1 Tax=Lolium multiflorum TaxID=4521 RepID=A0AAD8PKR0_LOLMU|nr:hypothetical protein QYE76_008035 [Lolium multiflorum]